MLFKVLAFVVALLPCIHSYTKHCQSNAFKKSTQRLVSFMYQKSKIEIEGSRNMIQKTDMILVTPMETVSMEEITQLNKFFNQDIKKELLNSLNLRLIVDGTPHVLLSNDISNTGVYYAIFIEKERESQKAYDIFMKWIRTVQSREDVGNLTFYVSKRFHLIRVSS